MERLKSAYDPEDFRRQGHALVNMLADYLADARSPNPVMPVLPWQEPQAQYDWWKNRLKSHKGDPHEDGLAFFRDILSRSIHLHQSRYMGHQVCPPPPTTALASLVAGLLNNGMAVYEMGASTTVLERICVETVAEVLGMDSGASGFLTSGGTLANLTALLAARSSYRKDNVWQDGQGRPLALMVSEQAHYCVDRAVRIMGWGSRGIIKVPVDDNYKMRTDLLENLLQESREEGIEVIAVVGSACTTSTGSFDDLEHIAGFCERYGLWFHVDGAHGAALAFSAQHRGVLKGIERADSVALDFHKMLMSPGLTTALVFRRGEDSYRTFAQQADYLFGEAEQEWFQMAKRSFECTKLMMSIKPMVLMHSYGLEVFEEYINQVMENGQLLANILESRPHWALAIRPQCNIVCFRLVPDGFDGDALNALNSRIRKTIVEEGQFYIVKTMLGSNVWLRVTLTNPFTSRTELEVLLDCAERVWRS